MEIKFKSSVLSRLVFSTICLVLVVSVFVNTIITDNEMAMWGWGFVVGNNLMDFLDSLTKYLKKRKRKLREEI